MQETDGRGESPEMPGDEDKESCSFYRIRFRRDGMHFTAASSVAGLERGTLVLVTTDHGSEPAEITGPSPLKGCCREAEKPLTERLDFLIERQLLPEEFGKYEILASEELEAYKICNTLIDKHQLQMNLVRVEKFSNGSKMIFYFTAENRVDFRALVKDLVHEFRTRVEMRQVGVRHETKMIGGIGTCGRELCCSSFIKNFESVSIKMAKEQDLPLNPTKISGVCNRLLCCLTYEFETYKKQRKQMPKAGRHVRINNQEYLVKRQIPLQEAVVVQKENGEETVMGKDEWRGFQPVKKDTGDNKRKTNN